MAPNEAPIKTAMVPSNTPVHKLEVDAEKTNPAPNVNIEPGIKKNSTNKVDTNKCYHTEGRIFFNPFQEL